MSKLKWKLLTKKRGSSTQGVPPGKEDLAWVTNTVTLIYGQRDAVLVDTFLFEQQSKELVDWVVESGKTSPRNAATLPNGSSAASFAVRYSNSGAMPTRRVNNAGTVTGASGRHRHA